jgi:peroxiredoxin
MAEGPVGRKVEDFSLPELRGKTYSLGVFKTKKLVVVAFLGTECPLAKVYAPRLAAMAKEYAKKNVAFVGINSNAQDTLAEIAASAKEHGVEFPLLKDQDHKVADQFGAQRTPEVFVLDEERLVRYYGRIDDQYGIGFVRDKTNREDLRIALDELLAGKEVSQPHCPAVGCCIGRVRKGQPQGDVTWSNQVVRIVQTHCVECHRPGEVGPFSLLSYDDAAPWSDAIAEAVRENRMPPWHADPKFGKFSNDTRLSDEEKKHILEWAKDGAPEGDKAQLPPLRKFVAGWQLPREPDVVVPARKVPFKVPAEGTLDYQYFIADPGFKEDKWVQGVEIVPGNRAVLHHAIVFVKGRNARFDEGEGFLACYVPGTRAQPFPPGMAKRIPAGAKLSFQMHYVTTGTPQEDLTTIGLLLARPEEVKHVVLTGSASLQKLSIPPQAADHQLEAVSPAAPVEIQLLSMMPHMHLRGKSFTYESQLPSGGGEMLLDVPRYSFDWQTSYLLTEPMRLPAGVKFRCVAHFDNSSKNLSNPDPGATVRWGPKSSDEMFFGYFDYAIAREHIARIERQGR